MRVCARLGSCSGGHRLRDAEVDDLRHRFAVEIRHQKIAGLQVTVDHALLMGMLNGTADLQEQIEPLVDAEPMAVAVLRHRNARHVLHREVRPSRGRRTRIDDVRDARVAHERQRLPLGFEARDDLARIHAGFDDLERHSPHHGFGLLGEIHLAHRAFADALQQAVRTDLQFLRHRQRCAQGVAGFGAIVRA